MRRVQAQIVRHDRRFEDGASVYSPVFRPMKLLFICTRNQLRSPTAQVVLAEVEGVQALSAGTNHDAETPLSGDLIEWADEIYCMERTHYKKLQSAYAPMLKGKTVRILGIKDNYAYMDPALMALIKAKFVRWFG